jgi:hypothetical protein
MRTRSKNYEQAIPGARVLYGYRNESWSAQRALAELVDNSRGTARGNADNIWIRWDPLRRILSVLDDGVGMTPSVFELFTLGRGAETVEGDPGMYGLGGSRAILWLYDNVTIHTLKKGQVNSEKVNWLDVFRSDEFPWISTKWEKSTPRNTPEVLRKLKHGTLITGRVRKEKIVREDLIVRELERMFAPALRAGTRIFFASHDDKSELEPFTPKYDEKVKVKVRFKGASGKQLEAHGEVGYVQNLTPDYAKVSVSFADRVILNTRDFFCDLEGNGVGALHVTGLITLKGPWEPTVDKSGLVSDSDYRELVRLVIPQIQDILDREKEAKMSVALNDLELKLTGLLDGNLKLPRQSMEVEPFEGEPNDPPQPRKQRQHPEQPLDPDGKKKDPRKAGSIKIVPVSNDDIKGAVVSLDGQDNAFVAMVNKDMAYVQDNIDAGNMDLITDLVVGELAAKIHDGGPKLINLTFEKREARNLINQSADEGMLRRQLIHRALVDKLVKQG